MNRIKEPLVSVVIITYNSSKYVIDTLDSIKKQTYSNIELIVSDDCSTDNTVDLCRQWIDDNKGRFIRTQMVIASDNTGIAGNVNRGYQAAKGVWIKGLAGDDMLMSDCIEKNVEYVSEYPNTELLFSKIKPFGDERIIERYFQQFHYEYFKLSRKKFLYKILLGNFIPASTCFMPKSLFVKLGGYDESMPFIEDWPFWIKAACNGVNFSFMDEYTVKYRMASTSISLTSKPSGRYKQSLEIAIDYSLAWQWKMNKLLWFYSYANQYCLSDKWWVKCMGYVLKAINPMFYYVRFFS